MSAPIYGPFASGAGASLGQDPYIDYLGPMMSGTNGGVNSSVIGGTSCQVYANSSGLVVLMRPGSCLIRGVMFHSDVDYSITVAANPSGSTRTDLVVMRLDRTAGTLLPHIIQGTPGAAAPSPVQAVGGVWDSPLAQVVVTAGSTGITPGQVYDAREYLNLVIQFCDSRNGYPPADGSQGRIFYDNNPAVQGLIVTNGGSWQPVLLGSDTGWVNTSGSPSFYGNPQARRVGNVVDFRADLDPAVPGYLGGAVISTLPSNMRPDIARRFAGSAVVGNFTAGYPGVANIVINPDGTVVLEGWFTLSGSSTPSLRLSCSFLV